MGKGTKQRSRWDIIEDMLKVILEEGKAKRTRIMQRSNLDWRSFKRYFGFLVERGFVGSGGNAGESKTYKLTKEGKDLLTKLQEVRKVLEDDLEIENKREGEGKGDNVNVRVY